MTLVVSTRGARTAPGHEVVRSPTTSTTSTTSTTTPRRVPVTTTTPPGTVRAAADPVTRDGTFSAGETSVTARVGSVREVSVSVHGGVKVTLAVTCGLTEVATTSVSTATVRVDGGASTCVATFTVPAGSPEPAPWRLVTW